MTQLPSDVWLHIMSFLNIRYMHNLLSINKSLHNLTEIAWLRATDGAAKSYREYRELPDIKHFYEVYYKKRINIPSKSRVNMECNDIKVIPEDWDPHESLLILINNEIEFIPIKWEPTAYKLELYGNKIVEIPKNWHPNIEVISLAQDGYIDEDSIIEFKKRNPHIRICTEVGRWNNEKIYSLWWCDDKL